MKRPYAGMNTDLASLPPAQRDQIAAMRAYLKPSPVKQGRLPKWFHAALLSAYGTRQRRRSGVSVLYFALGGAGWLDHYGATVLSDGREAFVCEPYEFMPEQAQDVARVADRLGCQWWVTANAWWYPGRTVRIVFAPRQEAGK